MRKILVTAISGDIGNGIVKILKDTDCKLYGCDINEIAVGMDNVDEFWTCKLSVDPLYIPELLAFCKKNNITHLIPVNEREIEVVDKNRELFENEGIKLIIQSHKILSICLDKFKTAQELREHGLFVPDTYIDDKQLNPKDKYIVKPRKSNGSKGIRICSGNDLLKQDVSDDMVIQEYIEGDEYTLGIFKKGDIFNTIAFKRELKNGYSNRVELVKDEDIVSIAKSVSQIFDLYGYINVQMRKRDGKYIIFEINPRISGTVRFRHMLGFEDVKWWLNCSDELPVQKYECRYNKAIGIRELNEKYLILE